jgi:type I restriction enzyme, S subunit
MSSDWTEVPFGEVLAEPVRNGLYKPKKFHGDGAKIVNMGELFAHPRLGAVEMRRLSVSEDELERFSVQPGDLLFARRSLVAEGAGRCALVVEAPEPTVFESSIIRARPDPTTAVSEFLYYFFSSRTGQQRLQSILRQVAVSGITGSDLVQLPVPLPTFDEQRRIAGVLTSFDHKIEHTRLANRHLASLAELEFRRLVSGLGRRLKPFTNLADVISGGTPRTTVASYWGGPIPWFSVVDTPTDGDVFVLDTERSITAAGLESSAATMLPEFSTVLTARGTVGNVALAGVPLTTNQSCYGIVPREHRSGAFVYFTTRDLVGQLRQRSHGSVFETITRDTLRSLQAVDPPRHDLESFERAVQPLMLAIRAGLRERDSLLRARDTLLPKLISGRIRVANSYDPDEVLGAVLAPVVAN